MAIDGLQLQSLWIIPTEAVSQHVFGQVELEELVLDGEEAASGAADVEVAGAKAAKVEEEGEEEEEEEEAWNRCCCCWCRHDVRERVDRRVANAPNASKTMLIIRVLRQLCLRPRDKDSDARGRTFRAAQV